MEPQSYNAGYDNAKAESEQLIDALNTDLRSLTSRLKCAKEALVDALLYNLRMFEDADACANGHDWTGDAPEPDTDCYSCQNLFDLTKLVDKLRQATADIDKESGE